VLRAPATGVTLAEALALPALRAGMPRIRVGADRLDTPIRWVHAGDFADMASVLSGGELLLTTGIPLTRGEGLQRRYVADLARRGVAGIVLELGSALARTPPVVLEEARRRELPLVELHEEIAFVEVAEQLTRRIATRQAALLAHAVAVQDRFAELLTAGEGTSGVLAGLADAVEGAAVLAEGDHVLRVAAGTAARDVVLAKLWAARCGLPDAPETYAVDVGAGDARLTVVADRRPLGPFDRVAAERAAGLLAIALSDGRERERFPLHERGEFLQTLIDPGDEPEEAQARRAAWLLGFAPRSGWLLPVAIDASFGARSRTSAIAELERQLASRRLVALAGLLPARGVLGLVLELRDRVRRDDLAGEVAAALSDAAGRASAAPPTAPVICVGAAATSWTELRPSLREAADAVSALRHAAPQRWHDVARPGLRQLVWRLRAEPSFARFLHATLAPLEEYDSRQGRELLHTLECFCTNGGRKAQTARLLGLERQTLYKRLSRIAEVLGVDLDDEDTRLALHLALRARRVLHEAAGESGLAHLGKEG